MRLLSTLSITLAAAAALGSAHAADLPARRAPPPVVVPPVFSWTGFYLGTTTGYAFETDQTIRTLGVTPATAANVALLRRPPAIRTNYDGFLSVGGGVGYDYQFTPGAGIVIGAAADATLTDLERRRGYVSPAQVANGFVPELSNFRTSLDWLGTVRGRVGYAFDTLLVYGTGGLAYGDVSNRAIFLRNTDQALSFFGRRDDIQTGWVAGGGIEYALPVDSIFSRYSLLSLVGVKSQAITVKVEALHYDLGSQNLVVNNVLTAPGAAAYVSRTRTEGNIVRGGFTYRFGSLGF